MAQRDPLPRQVSLLHRGRQSLSVLRRANEGDVKPLHKILSMAYGRSGKRRRELMEKLMAPEVPQNSEALGKLQLEPKYTREWKPPAQLWALMRSQKQEVDYLGENKRKIKSNIVIPETNLWGKEMPKSRVKNTTREWYAKQTNNVFPPLPENERQDLRALATGERDWWPILRRTQLGRPSALEVFEQGLQQTLLDGPQKGRKRKERVEDAGQKLTHRLMRRLWAYIYRHVPTMAYNPENRRWRVYWHDASRNLGQASLCVVDESRETILFGEVEAAPKSSRPASSAEFTS